MRRNNIAEENILYSLALHFLNKVDVSCGPKGLEDCHRIKGGRAIVKFSSKRKPYKVGPDGTKFDFNAGAKLHINEILCAYCRGLWRKFK